MFTQISMLSLVACVLYAFVACAAGWAGKQARSTGQLASHSRNWWLICVLFLALIVLRLVGLEDLLREYLRGLLEAGDLVADRRSIQGPIIAVALIVFAFAAMFAVYWVAQHISGRRNIALAIALGACGVMGATIVMRTISLHALDRLLNGPLKLNWVGDIGASVTVLIAAIVYIRIVSGKANSRR